MIMHVVMFKLHDTPDKQTVLHEIKRRLDSLPSQISEIISYSVGLNVLPSQRAYDMVLVSAFASLDTLAAYNTHSAHVEHLDFIRSASAGIVAVDYEAANLS